MVLKILVHSKYSSSSEVSLGISYISNSDTCLINKCCCSFDSMTAVGMLQGFGFLYSIVIHKPCLFLVSIYTVEQHPHWC